MISVGNNKEIKKPPTLSKALKPIGGDNSANNYDQTGYIQDKMAIINTEGRH